MVSFHEVPFENCQANRIEKVFLDGPLERSRPVNRIVTLVGQELLRIGVHNQPKPLPFQSLPDTFKLKFHNIPQLFPA